MSGRAELRRLVPYVIAAAGGFLLAYLAMFLFLAPGELTSDEGKVPNVVGMEFDEATRQLEAAGYGASRGESRFHATAPEGAVLAQAPIGGSREMRGAKVLLDVSAGQRRATVPDVVGLPRQDAQVALENAGFEVEVIGRESDQPAGRVLSTTPPPGTSVVLPAGAQLVVSGGPTTVEVPTVTGLDLPTARSILERAGLQVAIVPDSTGGLLVVTQEPAAGTVVPLRTTVRISATPRPTEEP